MPGIEFIDHSGRKLHVEARTGQSAMMAAVSGGVLGILAECGGACMCATCHVYVESASALPPLGPDENAMLDETASPRQPNSRLSCQLRITEDMDGLVLRVPPTQI